MGLLDFIPDNERYKLARMRQLDYKQGRDEPVMPAEELANEPVDFKPFTVKPPTMPEDDWKTALTVFSPERIKEIYGSFNPESTMPFYENVYQSLFKKPDAPDERKMEAARSMSGVGDALSLIAQSIAAGAGSFIEKRDPQNDATAQTDAVNERLREAYRRERDQYNAGFWGAKMKDTEGAKGDYQRDRAALLALLAKKRDAADRDRKFAGEMVYKYEKMGGDDADRKARLKLQSEANQIKRDNLAWQKEKSKLPEKNTPRGYLDFYDPTTGMTYRVADKKWKSNYTQIFDRVKDELYKIYPLLKSQERMGSLKPSEKEEYVKQFVYDNPKALRFLENIAESVFKDGEPEPVEQLPTVSDEQYRMMYELSQKHRKDEVKALSEIGLYLKSQGFKPDEIRSILMKIQYEK